MAPRSIEPLCPPPAVIAFRLYGFASRIDCIHGGGEGGGCRMTQAQSRLQRKLREHYCERAWDSLRRKEM